MICPRHFGSLWLLWLSLAPGIGRAIPPEPPSAVASDPDLLAALQRSAFDFFWQAANPTNGLIPDRTQPNSKCSIAAVGFGLSALPIGVQHGWVARRAAADRAARTLRPFPQGIQGPDPTGTIGYHGWFYHFLEMNTAFPGIGRRGTSTARH